MSGRLNRAMLLLGVFYLSGAALFAASEIHPAALAAFKAGLAHHNGDNLTEAERNYRAALSADPSLVSAAVNLGIIYEKWRKPAEAEKFYNEAVRVAPRSFLARYNRGQFLQKKGELALAAADYTVARDLSPQEASLYINLAAIEIRLFEKERNIAMLKSAAQNLHQAERLRSKSPALYFNRARLFELGNFPARARDSYEEAMRYYAPQSIEYRTCVNRVQRLARQLSRN